MSSNGSNFLERLDNAVRHRSVLGRHEWLRNLLRRPYHAFLRLNRKGYELNLGGCIPVRVPPEYASKLMEDYEKEEFEQIKWWCAAHPLGLVIDVGCSQGYMSCAALFAGRGVRVVAIDTDLNSLKTTQRVCAYGGLERLRVVQGMISGLSSSPVELSAAVEATRAALSNPAITGDPGTHQYLNLNAPEAAHIPRHRLDDLLAGEMATGSPILVKCDVEGAELDVLEGATALLREAKPTLLVSVHPGKLPAFGRSAADVAAFLQAHGYTHTELAVDHEHHWLCLPVAPR